MIHTYMVRDGVISGKINLTHETCLGLASQCSTKILSRDILEWDKNDKHGSRMNLWWGVWLLKIDTKILEEQARLPLEFRPFTKSSKIAIGHANVAAKELNHEYLGTEHLLLGLVCASDTLAGLVLEPYRDEIVGKLESLITPGPPDIHPLETQGPDLAPESTSCGWWI